jgi:hypothetical protein
MTSFTKYAGAAVFTLVLALGVAPSVTHAASDCGFTRDLSPGVAGEDVRCLQRYLNGAGFIVPR